MVEMLQYSFMVRGLAAGLIAAVVCPATGLFLVLRRYSLMADTLSHVALAGVGFGLLSGFNPGLAALGASVLGALGIDFLRSRRKLYGEAALAIFLSGSLATGVILFKIAGGLNADVLGYLFGSITTVSRGDLLLVGGAGLLAIGTLALIFKELFSLTLDEEFASITGIPTRPLNVAFSLMVGVTVALALRTIGVLLVGALMVIPVLTGLLLATGIRSALGWSLFFAILAVCGGVAASFYLDVPAGAAITLLALGLYGLVALATFGLRLRRFETWR